MSEKQDSMVAGKLAWITGASSGIGRALALRLAREGWRVAVSARRTGELEALAAEAPGRIFVFALDITDMDRSRQVHGEIEAALGPIDLAVLAAGIYRRDRAWTFKAAKSAAMISVNLQGVCNALEPLLETMMLRRAGQIAIVASMAGYVGLPNWATYGATKAALHNLCESLSLEAGRYGVSMSIVNPGFVETALTADNDYTMPFIISADAAADHIMRGLKARRYEIIFPWQMRLAIKTLHILPARLRFIVTRRLVSRWRDGGP